jgi:hypothetical protein
MKLSKFDFSFLYSSDYTGDEFKPSLPDSCRLDLQ